MAKKKNIKNIDDKRQAKEEKLILENFNSLMKIGSYFKSNEFQEDFLNDMEKYGITNFYLMAFKKVEDTSGKIGMITGMNIINLSKEIQPFHVVKKLLGFIDTLPEESQKMLLEILTDIRKGEV